MKGKLDNIAIGLMVIGSLGSVIILLLWGIDIAIIDHEPDPKIGEWWSVELDQEKSIKRIHSSIPYYHPAN